MKIVSCYPNPGSIDEAYLLGVTELLEGRSSETLDRLTNVKTGIASRCEYVPNIAQITEFLDGPLRTWSDGSKHREPERFSHGPNFTHSSETPDPRPKSLEERKAFVIKELGYDPARGAKLAMPAWLTHPDPNAPWRKPNPPSRELAKLLADDPNYQANLAARDTSADSR